jgi:hypothetical protein
VVLALIAADGCKAAAIAQRLQVMAGVEERLPVIEVWAV